MGSDASGDEEEHCSKHGAWTPEEDKLLACYQKQYGNRWSVVAQHIPGRTGQQCAQRWRHKVNPHIRKEKWTADEDRTLASLVAEYGNRWADIAKHIPGRTDQQCMGRWRRHLDPNIRKCSWLAREDEILKSKYQEIGSQWSNISKFLAGRTAQQCRARWFQICPQEAQEIVALRDQSAAACTTHKRERHYDGNSIKASAKQLLAQMARDSGAKSAPRAARGGARKGAASAGAKKKAPPASQSSGHAEDDEDEWVSHPVTRKASGQAKPAQVDNAATSDSDRPQSESRARSNARRPRASPAANRGGKSAGPPAAKAINTPAPVDRSDADACVFAWKTKGRRSRTSTAMRRRARTPSPCKQTDDAREDLVFFTPRAGQERALPADAEPADIEAADILTELSGSFHLLNSRKSPASVKQAPFNLLATPSSRSPRTAPFSQDPLTWGDSRALLSPNGRLTPMDGLDDLGTPIALHGRVFDPMGLSPMPHDLLMTPSSRNMLNKMSIEPLSKNIDLSVGFTPASSQPLNTPASRPSTGVKRRPDSEPCSPDDDALDKRTAARRLHFCAGNAPDADDGNKTTSMPPPPPQTHLLESPQKRRRVDTLRVDVKAEPTDVFSQTSAGSTLAPTQHTKPPTPRALDSAAAGSVCDARTPADTPSVVQTPALTATMFESAARMHGSAFLQELATLPPANKENRLQGNARPLDVICGQGSGASSSDHLDIHMLPSNDSCDDAVDAVVVDASSCQIKNHLENLLDDMFSGI